MLPDPPRDPFNNLDPAQTVRVLPRHLAGPGQADLETIWAFPFDDGWHLHQGLEGMVFAISPCARLWTRFAPRPEERGPDMWTIGMDRAPFGPRAWEITFDATTPPNSCATSTPNCSTCIRATPRTRPCCAR